MPKRVVDPQNAKTLEYRETLKAIERTKKCPFCSDNFRYHKKPILRKANGWFITKSSWPYQNSRHHFLLICGRHKESFRDLKPSDLGAILRLGNWAIKKYKISGGGLALRFGNTVLSGSTVCHLHFHLIVPQMSRKRRRAAPVYFLIG